MADENTTPTNGAAVPAPDEDGKSASQEGVEKGALSDLEAALAGARSVAYTPKEIAASAKPPRPLGVPPAATGGERAAPIPPPQPRAENERPKVASPAPTPAPVPKTPQHSPEKSPAEKGTPLMGGTDTQDFSKEKEGEMEAIMTKELAETDTSDVELQMPKGKETGPGEREQEQPAQQSVVPPSVPDEKAASEPKTQARKTAIRTYESDAAAALQNKKASLSSIALAEEERRRRVAKAGGDADAGKPKLTARLRRLLPALLVVLGVALLAGGGFLVVRIFLSGSDDTPPALFDTREPLFFVNDMREIAVGGRSRQSLLGAVDGVRTRTEGSLGSITEVIFTDATGGTPLPVSASDLLAQADARVPSAFLRTLDERFLFGVHVFDNNQALLVLKVRSFDTAFAGMLVWEPFIVDDVPFLLREKTTAEATGSGPTTPLATLSETPFRDVVIKNRDARAILDENGDVRMVYSFPDTETLIITTNQNTLAEVFTRLSSSRFQLR